MKIYVEIQAHGNIFVLNLIIKAAIANGARMAKAGEFTERAFLNNKPDLAQAEAVADIINASETAANQQLNLYKATSLKK